jgi:hypothetical protein
MKTRIFTSALVMSFLSPTAFAQMTGYGGGGMPQGQAPQSASGQSQSATTTTSKKVMPVGVKGYLDDVISHSNDKKFHLEVNGKDLPLTPIKIHGDTKGAGNKTITPVDMKSADGKMYEINFVSSGGTVTGAKIAKINGKAP